MPKIIGNAYWAKVYEPDTKWDPMWKINLVMSDSEAQKLKDVGIKVKRNDDGNYEYKFKRKVNNAKGGQNRPPVVVGPDKEPFTQLIGNGSKVCIIFKVFEWKYTKGTGADLDKIMVLEHIPYGDGTSSQDEDFDDPPAEKPKAKQDDEDF